MVLTFAKTKQLLEKAVGEPCEPELWLVIGGVEYMIIAYEDYCSFQRCRGNGIVGSGEIKYDTLDELYKAEQPIDGIKLSRDWNKIEDMYSYDIDLEE